eukprot:5964970-Amphidinium_carterae.1
MDCPAGKQPWSQQVALLARLLASHDKPGSTRDALTCDIFPKSYVSCASMLYLVNLSTASLPAMRPSTHHHVLAKMKPGRAP